MFKKNPENMSLEKLTVYITKTFHEPLRKDLSRLDTIITNIISDNLKKYPQLVNLQELFYQFKTEVLKHITREDLVVFPTILRFEKIYNDNLINLSDNFEIIDDLVNGIQMINQHKEFNLYLNSIIQFLEEQEGNNIENDIKELRIIKDIFKKIQSNNITHSKLENERTYLKGVELQNKLKERIKSYKSKNPNFPS